MQSIITVLVDDAEAALSALSALAPKPATAIAVAAAPTPAAPAATSVSAQISAVTFTQGVSALGQLWTALSAKAASIPSDAILAAEDIAGMLDPDLIPIIGGVEQLMPLITAGLGLIEAGTAVPGNYWPGDPSAIGPV